jgi:hypothetical protein
MQLIIDTESQIYELAERVKFLNAAGGLQKIINIGRVQNKINELNKQQFYNIDSHLADNSNEHKQLIERNYELLKTPKIRFTVYSNSFSFLGSYTKNVDGHINPNGYSYSHSVRTNFSFLPFDSMRFPTEMKGHVDYWGKLTLKTSKTSYALFKSLPKHFEGYVDTNGYIQIDNVRNDWEVLSNGGTTIGQLIANHFEYDEGKNQQFQSNISELSENIHKFWEQIKADNKR